MLFAPLALASLALSVAGRHIPLAGRSSHDHLSRNSDISNINKRSYSGGNATWFSWRDSPRDLFCGTYYESDEQMLCALNLGHMLHTAHTDPNCMRWITVAWEGRTVDVQVQDACAEGSCVKNPYHVDLSPGAFKKLCGYCNHEEVGTLMGVEWWFKGEGPQSEQPPVEEKPKWTPTSTWTPEPETSTWTPEPETSTWTPPAEPSHLVEETSSTSMSAITSSTTSSSSPSSLASGLSGNLTTSALNSTTPSSTATDTRVSGSLTASVSASITVPMPGVSGAITPDHIAHTDGNIDGNLAQINHLVATFGRIILTGVSI